MKIQRVVVGPLATNCYVLSVCGIAVVIDPGAAARRIRDAAAGLNVAAVLLTHGHADHLSAAGEFVEKDGAPLYASPKDFYLIRKHLGALKVTPLPADGNLSWGELTLRVIPTPGHTPGSCCFYAAAEKRLFSGDTLFRYAVGRTDLPGGSAEDLSRSVRERLFTLPDDTVVYPGHDEFTTIGEEKRCNPFVGEGV